MFTAMLAAVTMFAPVYLECQLSGTNGETAPNHPYNWQLTMNEAEGRVDWSHPQASNSTRAVFTANEVRWGNFTVDRRTMTFTRRTPMTSGDWVTTGKCRVAPPAQRAF